MTSEMNFDLPVVDDIREHFKWLLENEQFVQDKTGVDTIEIAPALFVADEESIFGKMNWDYVDREIEWYESQSRFVQDIPGKTPEIWNQVCDSYGLINSNYGWCIYSHENGNQYENVLECLKNDPLSRRAVMIYNRPSMHYDYNRDGMSDFICTHAVQYLIRDNRLHAEVTMRSSDSIFGYRNDRAWQQHVLESLATDLGVEVGCIFWYSGSLHVYSRHFHLIE